MEYRSQKQVKKASDPRLNLEACIELEQEKVTRSRVLFHGIRFNLNKDILQRIEHAQQIGDTLTISSKLLADWRYYALIDTENRLQSGLTFCTYYRLGESNLALMRSIISLDGDIINQIRNDCLERPHFSRQIASAHYWLIQQLIEQLRLETLIKLNQLLTLLCWSLALLIAAAMVIPFMPIFLENPWMVLAAVIMTLLFQVGLQRLVGLFLPTIRRWVWRWILSGLLSHKPNSKRRAKGILAWLVS